MSNETKHTPTPWKAHQGLIYRDTLSGGMIAQVVDSMEVDQTRREMAAHISPEEANRNIDLIVTACNSHDALLEALTGLAGCAGLTWLPGYKDELDDAMRTARAAIADAEGGA